MNSQFSPSPAETIEPTRENQHTSQDIEDFIYLISHDVRGSVRALLELPQWIAEDLEEAGIKIEGSVASSIDLMNRHTGRLDRMLVDLLTYSRIGRLQTAGKQSLCETLADVLEQIKLPPNFHIDHVLNHDEVFMGDRDLPTLLSALIQNGIKHHDRPSGRIVVESRTDNNEILLCVSDDGPGVPEEFYERALSPMTTLRPRDEVEGSGMGLANVRKIAAHYGGSVTLGSSPYGRGTQVRVRLKPHRAS